MFRNTSLKLVAILSLLILFVPTITYAQTPDQIGFSISPYSYEYELKPGQEVTATLRVENINTKDITVTIGPENLVAYGQDGQFSITEDEPTFAIKNWITIPQKVASIKPKEFAYFDYKVTVPKDAEPGSHYGALSIQFTDKPKPLSETGATVVQKSSAIILLRVTGDVKEELNLVYFQPEKFFYTDPHFKLSALFENKGTVNIKPFGEINIYDLFGNKIKNIKITGKNILPNKKTIFAQTNFIGINWPVLFKYLLILLAVIVFYIVFRKRINKAIKILLKGDK